MSISRPRRLFVLPGSELRIAKSELRVWRSRKAKPVSIRAARQLHPGTRIPWRRYCGASYLEDDRLWRVLPAGRKVSASCEAGAIEIER
jgi:hypothetical protein